MPEILQHQEDVNLGSEIDKIHAHVEGLLIENGVSKEQIGNGDVRLPSILYMTYWFNRLKNNTEEQARIGKNLTEYIGTSVPEPVKLTSILTSDQTLVESSKRYVENLLVPSKTVDLVITKADEADKVDKEVLCIKRTYYPYGLSLPGGFIKDTDEDNELGLPPDVFTALRVAGEKVLGAKTELEYSKGVDKDQKPCFFVRNKNSSTLIRIYPEDEGGYRYNENIKSVLRPSDPRHIVDTIGFKCEVEGDLNGDFVWRSRSSIMASDEPNGGFAFGHHREIVALIASQTSLDKERKLQEHEFIRSIVDNPLEKYNEFKKRFEAAPVPEMASFPEFVPVIKSMIDEKSGTMFTEEINKMCEQTPLLAGIRDTAIRHLRQVMLKNRTLCPYFATVEALEEAVMFFDYVARQKRGFFDSVPKDKIIEHDPKSTPFAFYHDYRYSYRHDDLKARVPHEEIIIPTFEPLSATDLLKIRGVPIRFVGMATDNLYVDEFEQTPREFYMHDINHSWRMGHEDRLEMKKSGKTRADLVKESNEFLVEYLPKIKILKTDTEEQREIKKLKKIILFEIVHEDARPFLRDTIGYYIQQKEGGNVPFEVPRIDKNGDMDIVDRPDTGISTLSYVRNKLQHGFYDHVDAQLPQIVDPRYRTSAWIAKAAYEMLVELNSTPREGVELDNQGHVSYEWLLKRTTSVGPDNIHEAKEEDPDVKRTGDGAERVNPKTYQVGSV